MAAGVEFPVGEIRVRLTDGRPLSVPLSWYPRLAHASAGERSRWELTGRGTGSHWPDLDEDLCVDDPLAGLRSAESPASFERWLRSRNT